jgi:hypothetical protein
LNLGTDNQERLPSGGPSQGITHRASATRALSELMKPTEHATRATQIHPPFALPNAPSPSVSPFSPFSPRLSEVFSHPSGQYGVNWSEKDSILVNNNLSNWNWSFDDAEFACPDSLFSSSMVSLGNPITLEQSIFFNPNEFPSSFSSMGQDIAAAMPNHALSKISGPCTDFSFEEKLPDTWDMLKMLRQLNLPNSSLIRISEHYNQHVTGSGGGLQKPERQFLNKMLVESLILGQDRKLAPKNDDGAIFERVSEMPEAANSQTLVTDGECNWIDPKIFAIFG